MAQMPHKLCPRCQRAVHLSAPACDGCGHTFETQYMPAQPDPGMPPQYQQQYPPQYSGYPPPYQQPYPPQAQPPYPPQNLQQYPPPYPAPYGYPPQPVPYAQGPTKVGAALFAFFLGGFGAHGFYTGNTSMGVTLLLVSLISIPLCLVGIGVLGIFAVSIITLIQTILYASATDYAFYQKYVLSKSGGSSLRHLQTSRQ